MVTEFINYYGKNIANEMVKLICEDQLQLMQKTAFIISVSRGIVVDSAALTNALEKNLRRCCPRCFCVATSTFLWKFSNSRDVEEYIELFHLF